MRYKILGRNRSVRGYCLACQYSPTRAVSANTLITPGLDGKGANGSFLMGSARSLSRDGRITVFATQSTNHVPNDTNGKGDIFAYDRITKKTELVSHAATGQPSNGESLRPTVSANGRHVAYLTLATDIPPGVNSNCPSPNQCGM